MYLLGALSSELSTLNVEHQIATTNVLHDEVHSSLRLETSVEVRQERVPFPVGDQEHPLFRSHALNLVVFNNELLLENFDRIQSPRTLRLGQHDLSEVALTQNCQEIEVIETYPLSRTRIGCQR